MSSRWIPLESNPDVLNAWVNRAGLAPGQAQFEDIYGLDEELLMMVSAPVRAVLLLFPITETLEARRKGEDAEMEGGKAYPVDKSVWWIKQRISNACGTIGLLHAIVNANLVFKAGSTLAKFTEECREKSPEERAQLLATTPLFADIHREAASTGQTAVPTNLDTDLHFTCFVQAPDPQHPGRKRLIELDGRRNGPIDRGQSGELLRDVGKFVKEIYVAQSASVHFSMVSLGPVVD